MADERINGAAARAIRQRSELSIAGLVEALAEQGVSVHEDHLRNVELGHKNASPPLIGAWAKALKVPKIAILANPPETQAHVA